VLGDRALAVGEIRPSHELFDYECKYTPGMTEEIFPATIDSDIRDRLQSHALAAHRALKLRDFSRIDFKEDADGVAMCLEANTLPGMTATSLLPQSAAAAGISFVALLEKICSMVIARARGGNKDYP
jgi:D-alanine-D-alanine ligase